MFEYWGAARKETRSAFRELNKVELWISIWLAHYQQVNVRLGDARERKGALVIMITLMHYY